MGFIKRILRTALRSAAVCAGVGVCVAAYRYFNGQERFTEFFNGLELIAPPIIAVLLSLVIWKTPFSVRHWKWDAFGIVVFAVPILLFSVMLFGNERTNWYSSPCDRFTFLFAWLVLPIAFAIFRYYSSRKGKPRGQSLSAEGNITELSADELIKWANDDKPSEKDYFGFTQLAEQIAERIIAKASQGKNATIALRGKMGAGKTTVINIVQSYIAKKDKRFIFANVSCWGFDNTQSAQQYIIEKIINAMTNAGLDTDHLIGAPKKYVQALAKIHTFFDIVSELFYEENTPEKNLKRIDDTLKNEKTTLVLIIEDLDRNEGCDFQLDNIEATLWRFRNLTTRISFILTGFYRNTNERNRI
jgi:hypothetical protein